MSCFADAVLPSAPPDATKHVNYSYGMVLGVEEFVQEFAYLSAWDRSLARELIGYGTVRGLKVEYTTRGGEPELVVSDGVAVVPPGYFARICQDQCAKLNPWLSAHRAEVEQALTGSSPIESVRLAVVLRHYECLTDEVPIPGEPCRSDEDAMAPSRVKDDFRLELRLIAPGGGNLPDQKEEDVLRQFAAALKAVPVEGSPVNSTREAWAELLKQWEWIPGSNAGSGLPGAAIPQDESTEYYRDAFRIWATELRPRYACPASNMPPTPPPQEEQFLLLAEVEVYLTSQLQVHDTLKPHIDEQRRPVLLHLRLIQELLYPCPPGETIFPSPLSPAPVGPLPGNAVVQERDFGQLASPGSSLEYSRADHTHGTPVLPELAGEVQGAYTATRVARLAGVPIEPPASPPPALPEGQVLTLVGTGAAQRWAPAPLPMVIPTITLGGDVTGAPTANTVERIRGTTVAATIPTDRQILRCAIVGGQPQWVPEAFPPPPPITLGGDVTGAPTANTVGRIQGLPITNAPSADKQILQYQDPAGELQWVDPPAPPAPPNLDDVVRHPITSPRARYFLVAAGSFKFDTAGAGTVSEIAPPFNKLRADISGRRLRFRFGDYNLPNDQHQYIVKLTPWIPNLDGDNQLFLAILVDIGNEGIIVEIRFLKDTQVTQGQLQVEVSEYKF